jgi:Uma2 family endonuclease
MADAARKLMSVEEFFEWCRFQEERYELVDGHPIPLRSMAGASMSHDAIAANLIGQLYAQLRGTGCRPTTPDAGLRTAIRRVRRPDVTIECAPPSATSYEATNPLAVFEILSPTTRKNDRNIKLPEYLRHPALRMIVLIDPDVMDVLVYHRETSASGQATEWQDERLYLPEHRLAVRGTEATLLLADLYEGVSLQKDVPPPRDI